MAQAQFEIVEQIHQFPSPEGSQWHKELNKVSWFGKDPKYDIRDWTENHGKAGRGITLTESELRELVEAVEEILY